MLSVDKPLILVSLTSKLSSIVEPHYIKSSTGISIVMISYSSGVGDSITPDELCVVITLSPPYSLNVSILKSKGPGT